MKKQNKKNRLAIISLVALLSLGFTAGTIAYFSTATSFDNIFAVGNPEAQIVEEFTPPGEELIYGGTFDKKAFVANTGDYPVIARAKVNAYWQKTTKHETLGDLTRWSIADTGETNYYKAEDGKYYTEAAGVYTEFTGKLPDGVVAQDIVDNGYTDQQGVARDAAILNFGKTADFSTNQKETGWTSDDNTGKWYYDTDKWFYYNAPVAAKTTSDMLLDSVTISETLGETKDTAKIWYVKSDYDKWIKDIANVQEPTKYTTSAAASAASIAANGDGKATGVHKSELINTDFANARLTVTISGEVIQADEESYKAAGWAYTNKDGWKLKK